MMLTYSFINLLAGSYRDDHNTGTADIGRKGNRSIVSLVGPASPVDTPSSPTSPGPPLTQVLQAVAEMTEKKPSMPAPTGPTLRLSSQVVTASVEQYEPVQLRLIDTPGLNLSNDPVGPKARERGVAGLIRLLEERFEETLKEESRIIRTRKRQEDGMVHLGEL
jgi:septin family protein